MIRLHPPADSGDYLRWFGVDLEDGVTEAEWREAITRIVACLAEPAGEPALQDRLEMSLALLWGIMIKDRPPAVRAAYLRLQETRIAEIAVPRAAALGKIGYPAWEPNLSVGLGDLVLEVAAEIRALDQALDEVRDDAGRSADPNAAFAAWGGSPVFILPRPPGIRALRRRGQDFDRRGLVHNRILPQVAEGLPVRLHQPRVRGPGDKGEAAGAVSAVYRKLKLSVVRDADNTEFWIDGIANHRDVEEDLTAQLDQILDGEPAMAVVWPELSMSPPLSDQLRSGLAKMAWSDAPPKLGFVVEGSWHLERAQGRVNASQVLNRHGEPLLEIVKREPFAIEPGVLEAIVTGPEISVLIYGQVLIAFGICKDFCERRWTSAYRSLDVDFVVAPSFGTARTMEEHVVAAGDLSVGYGTRGFVVQQMDGADWGMVLSPGAEPRRQGVAARQNKLLARSTVSCTIA